jgi:hypothetical protein
MRTGIACAVFLSAVAALAQAPTPMLPRSPNQGGAARPSDANYGPPRVAELNAIVISDQYQRAHVITEGEVSPFQNSPYWILHETGATVLLIPGRDFDPREFDQVVGRRRTEVRGIVRRIRTKEYARGIDLDLIEDPILEGGAPNISITVFEIRDRTGGDAPGWSNEVFARRILEDPSAFSGKTTRIVGEFRGRNLFGDLPANSARSPADWVLKEGDVPLWVTGKAPKGDGWKLDPAYRGDSKFRLEVVGRIEVVNGILYLKASKVLMAKPVGGNAPPAITK